MKTLIAVILALGIGFAGAYVVVTKQKNAELAKLQQPQPAETPITAAAPGQKVIVKTVTAAPTGEMPEDILNDLLNVQLGTTGGERNTALRMVVFKLETLAQDGSPAVPAIRSFLGKNVDVDYNQQDNQNDPQANANDNSNTNNAGGNRFNRGGGGGGGPGGGRFAFRGARRARDIQSLQTDWVVPPSLRLGLVGTLKEIGGPDGEQALAEMLASTARGV